MSMIDTLRRRNIGPGQQPRAPQPAAPAAPAPSLDPTVTRFLQNVSSNERRIDDLTQELYRIEAELKVARETVAAQAREIDALISERDGFMRECVALESAVGTIAAACHHTLASAAEAKRKVDDRIAAEEAAAARNIGEKFGAGFDDHPADPEFREVDEERPA
jgi:hypothetical protein